MKKLWYLLGIIVASLILCLFEIECNAQDSVKWAPYYYNQKDDTIRNLEYITVDYFFRQKKLYHVKYMLYNHKKKWYCYPNHEPVHLINYKIIGHPEVTVNK